MPQVTAELRWFLDARNAADVDAFERWFRSGTLSPGGGKKPREDVYVFDPSLVEPLFFPLEFGSRKAR